MADTPVDNTLPAEEQTPSAAETTPTDDDAIVISREFVTNVVVASVFLLLGFVLGGLFGTGILVTNSDVVVSALVESAPALAQQPSGQQGTARQQQPSPPPAVIDNVSVDDDPFLGPADAPVTIVEFSDFACGFCGRFHQQTLPLILEEYGDKVRFVYRDFLAVGGVAQAQAAECAHDQNAFWPYHDELFEGQGAYTTNETLIALAGTLELNEEDFRTCLENETHRDEVIADSEQGREYGVTGTPTFFINGRRLVGAQPFAAFQEIIDEELAEAGVGTGTTR